MSIKYKYTTKNLQQLYDDAFEYFKNNTLGRCAIDINCKYYYNGNKCVIGHLVDSQPEDVCVNTSIGNILAIIDRNTIFEHSKHIHKSFISKVKKTFRYSETMYTLLTHLQRIHDYAGSWVGNTFSYTGYKQLEGLGINLKLDTTKVTEMKDKVYAEVTAKV